MENERPAPHTPTADGVVPRQGNTQNAKTPHSPQPVVQNTRRMARRARIQGRGVAVSDQSEEDEESGNEPGGSSGNRINGLTKWAMLIVALTLDLLPILALIGAVVFVIYKLGGLESATACINAYNQGVSFSGAGNAIKCGAGAGIGIISSGATLFLLGPLIYGLASIVSLVSAPFIFFIWFTIIKGVPYFSTKGGRWKAMLITGLIEINPLTSWLPGITFSTWSQIRISQKEDRAKNTE